MSTLAQSLAPGAGAWVYPAAGFSTGLYPASKVVQPELFPIIDQDGVTKPAILVNVEELLRSGSNACLFASPRTFPCLSASFSSRTHRRIFAESEEGQGVRQDYHIIGDKVTLVAQERQEGFGHALHCRDAGQRAFRATNW